MKRLLDETTDDFTRALLVAGIEQRPPAGNKRKVLLALGAGSALGLFSSHALAWLGTSGGKLSLLGVAVGVAGAVYAVSPWSETEASSGAAVASMARSLARSPAVVSPAVVPPAAEAEAASPAEHAIAPEGEPTGEPGVEARPAQARGMGDRASPASEPRRDKARPAVSAPSAVASPEEVSAPEVSPLAETEARRESASLDAEVRLVDDMHWAARRNDREALARFVATYHASFPDGQLQEEVAAFAARLPRPTPP